MKPVPNYTAWWQVWRTCPRLLCRGTWLQVEPSGSLIVKPNLYQLLWSAHHAPYHNENVNRTNVLKLKLSKV